MREVLLLLSYSCCCCNTEDKCESGGMVERGVQTCPGGFDSKIERKGFLSNVKVPLAPHFRNPIVRHRTLFSHFFGPMILQRDFKVQSHSPGLKSIITHILIENVLFIFSCILTDTLPGICNFMSCNLIVQVTISVTVSEH